MTIHQNDPTQLTLANGSAAVQGVGGNTGGAAGRYFETLVVNGTASLTFDSTTKCWAFNAPAGYVSRFHYTGHNSSTGFAVEMEFTGTPLPGAGLGGARLLEFISSSGNACRLEVLDAGHATPGRLYLYDSTGANVWTSSAAIPTSGGWRVYLGARHGTTNGELHCALYTGSDGKSLTAVSTYDSSVANCGTGYLTEVRMIKINSGPSWGTGKFRGVRFDDANYATVGPIAASSPGVVSALTGTGIGDGHAPDVDVATTLSVSMPAGSATAHPPTVIGSALPAPTSAGTGAAHPPTVDTTSFVVPGASANGVAHAPSIGAMDSVPAATGWGRAHVVVMAYGAALDVPVATSSASGHAALVYAGPAPWLSRARARIVTGSSEARIVQDG